MSTSRATRSLVLAAILAISPTLNAGDLRNLPFDLRHLYFDIFVLAYGLNPLVATFYYYFPQLDSHNFGATEATREIDNFWSDQWFYEPIIITTLDGGQIILSPEALIKLRRHLHLHSPVVAAAIADAPNQYRIQLPISSKLLNLLQNTTPGHPEGINLVFADYNPEELYETELEAQTRKCEYLSTQLEYFLSTNRKCRSPRSLSPECAQGPQKKASDDDAARTRKIRAKTLPPLPIPKIATSSSMQSAHLTGSPQLSPKQPIDEREQKALRRATTSLASLRRTSALVTTGDTTAPTGSLSGVKKTLSEPLTTSASSTITSSDRRTSPRSKLRRKNTSDPSTTEASTTATCTTVRTNSPRSKLRRKHTTEASNSESPLIRVVEWTADPEFQQVVGFYYPYIAADAELTHFLLNMDLKKENNRTFALSLISCLSTYGFPHKLDANLINAIVSILRQLNDRVDSALKSLVATFDDAVSTMEKEVSFKNGIETGAFSPRTSWTKYTDAEIVDAWTFCDSLTLRNMPSFIITNPALSKIENKLSQISHAFNNLVKWIRLQIKEAKDKKALVNRFISLATLMIEKGNFHSAYTIYIALLHDSDLAADRYEFLKQVFNMRGNYAEYYQRIQDLRAENHAYLYIAAFYSMRLEMLGTKMDVHQSGLGKCPKDNAAFDKQAAINIGAFLLQLRKDQIAANYEQTGPMGLVRFFMDLGNS